MRRVSRRLELGDEDVPDVARAAELRGVCDDLGVRIHDDVQPVAGPEAHRQARLAPLREAGVVHTDVAAANLGAPGAIVALEVDLVEREQDVLVDRAIGCAIGRPGERGERDGAQNDAAHAEHDATAQPGRGASDHWSPLRPVRLPLSVVIGRK